MRRLSIGNSALIGGADRGGDWNQTSRLDDNNVLHIRRVIYKRREQELEEHRIRVFPFGLLANSCYQMRYPVGRRTR